MSSMRKAGGGSEAVRGSQCDDVPSKHRRCFRSLKALFLVVAGLFLAGGAIAAVPCEASSSRIERSTCDDPSLASLAAELDTLYGHLVSESRGDVEVSREQRQWQARVLSRCATRDCRAAAYVARSEAIADRLVDLARPRDGEITEAEAKDACTTFASEADRGLGAGRPIAAQIQQWDDTVPRAARWTVSKEDQARIEKTLVLSGSPGVVFNIKLATSRPPVKFATFFSGGTCAAYDLRNVDLVLRGETDNVEIDPPDGRSNGIAFGASESPVSFKGRTFVVATGSDRRDLRQVAWLRPDGRKVPLCYIERENGTKRVAVTRSPLCSAIADGKVEPLAWRPALTEIDSAGIEHLFGRFGSGLTTLEVDLDNSGRKKVLGRTMYGSGAGCGSSHVYLIELKPDPSTAEASPLSGLLGGADDASDEIYDVDGVRYLLAGDSSGDETLTLLNQHSIETKCTFVRQQKHVVFMLAGVRKASSVAGSSRSAP